MEELKPHLAAFLVQSIYAGQGILSKVAFTDGMNTSVFVFYRMAIATFFLAPFAFNERKSAPPLSLEFLIKNFLLAFIGITLSQLLCFAGIDYTSPAVASAISNSLPVTTFFLAVILGMEHFQLRSAAGGMKAIGLVLCLAGVATIAFYNGPLLQPHLRYVYTSKIIQINHNNRGSWVKGTIILVASCIARSLWIVMQGKILLDYPSKFLVTTLQCACGMIQSFIVAIIFERDISSWKLTLNLDLAAVAYCGIVVAGIAYYLQAWIIEVKGPVFLAISTPLNMVITIVCSVVFLNSAISLGSILGGALLIGCLYIVLWAKSIEGTDLYLPIIDNDGREALYEPEEGHVDQIMHSI